MRVPLHHYKRPIISLAIASMSWLILGLVIWLVPPIHWIIEFFAFCLFIFALWLSLVWTIGRVKLGNLVTILVLILLVSNRFGILNFFNGGFVILVMGLLSLII